MKKYGRFFSSAVMANGECPSDFAALVTSPQSEEALSRAFPFAYNIFLSIHSKPP
ncbi:MAG: hypothetical protein V8R96_04415 [Gemmiger sp.]